MDYELFDSYPDVLDVVCVSQMLRISKVKVYELIHNKQIKGFLIGRKFRILKKEVSRYLSNAPVIQ